MRKFIALALLILLPFAAFESYDFDDGNLDIARSIFAERALEFGRKDVFKTQTDKIKNPRNAPAGVRAAELKNKISASASTPHPDIFKFLAEPNRDGDKLLVCALAASKCLAEGQPKNAGLYASMCNSIFKASNPAIVEADALEAVYNLGALDLKQAQLAAVEILFGLHYSNDMVLRIYALAGKHYASVKFSELLKDKEFCDKHKAFVKYIQKTKIICTINKRKESYVIRNFYYFAIEFSMSWKIQKWEDYKNPLLAHVYYCGGDMDIYRKYREKSISKEQLNEMCGAYFQYVEYAAKIFCMANDTQIAINLIKTLPAGRRKNLTLKRLARYLTSTKNAFEITMNSGLFD